MKGKVIDVQRIDRGGKVESRPVCEVDSESAQMLGSGCSDPAIVEGEHLMATRGGRESEAPVEPLRHRGGTRDEDAGVRRG